MTMLIVVAENRRGSWPVTSSAYRVSSINVSVRLGERKAERTDSDKNSGDDASDQSV